MDKLIDKIAQAEEKIEVLEKFEPAKGAVIMEDGLLIVSKLQKLMRDNLQGNW